MKQTGKNTSKAPLLAYAVFVTGLLLIVLSQVGESRKWSIVVSNTFREIGISFAVVATATILHEKHLRDEVRQMIIADLDAKLRANIPEIYRTVGPKLEELSKMVKEKIDARWIPGRENLYNEAMLLVRNSTQSCHISATDLYPVRRGDRTHKFQDYIDTIAKNMDQRHDQKLHYRVVAAGTPDGRIGLEMRQKALTGRAGGIFSPRITEKQFPLEVLITDSTALLGFPAPDRTLGFGILINNTEFVEFLRQWYEHYLWAGATEHTMS